MCRACVSAREKEEDGKKERTQRVERAGQSEEQRGWNDGRSKVCVCRRRARVQRGRKGQRESEEEKKEEKAAADF